MWERNSRNVAATEGRLLLPAGYMNTPTKSFIQYSSSSTLDLKSFVSHFRLQRRCRVDRLVCRPQTEAVSTLKAFENAEKEFATEIQQVVLHCLQNLLTVKFGQRCNLLYFWGGRAKFLMSDLLYTLAFY